MKIRHPAGSQLNSKRLAVIAASAVMILIVALAVITGPGPDTDNYDTEYEVTDLDMRIAVSRDHTCEVEEFISVDIPEDLRIIGFALPDGDYKLKDLTVEGKETKTVKRSQGRYAEIKDPQLLTAGHHRYRLTYRLTGPAGESLDKDVFNFEVLPAGWNKPVYKLHALMWFPYGFPLEDIRPYIEGSSDVKVTVKIEPQSRSYTIGARRIPEDHIIRLEADLPDGYWD